ncbi:hypothetical protein GIB67_039374, partial [Kingdonia uniflora]
LFNIQYFSLRSLINNIALPVYTLSRGSLVDLLNLTCARDILSYILTYCHTFQIIHYHPFYYTIIHSKSYIII